MTASSASAASAAPQIDLTGQKVLVTGGSRGIGRGIALACARAGADVAVNYVKSAEAAAETVAEIQKLGRKATALQGDMSKPADVKRVFAGAKEFLGGLDAAAINAGIASKAVFVRETADEEIERVFAVDLLGAYYCAREAAAIFHEQKHGLIVMISSVLAQTRSAKMGPYAVAKAALEGLMTMLAREEAQARVRVNNILPGLVNTDMGLKVVKPMGFKEVSQLGPAFPLGRVCEPEDIGNLFAFLASPAGSYITGQSIMVEGGSTLVKGMF
ncbi:MAG: SDR family oxidoreductase [Deltaproteobacteria bacterium]|nr:SDR family oxidoreductase [Deltaproteobacteria bacterium]